MVRSTSGEHAQTTVEGRWTLKDIQIRDNNRRRRVEEGNAEIQFYGDEARLTDASFRLGASRMQLDGVLRGYSDPVFQYLVRSEKLRLPDVPEIPSQINDSLLSFRSMGEIRAGNGTPSIQTAVSSSQGSWHGVPFRNLNSEVEMSAQTINVRRLSFESFGGGFSATAMMAGPEISERPFTLSAKITNLEVKKLLDFSAFKPPYALDGLLSLEAQLRGQGGSWTEVTQTLSGTGSARLLGGSLKNFNMAEAVLANVNSLPGIVQLVSKEPLVQQALALTKKDTEFDSLEAAFTLKGRKLNIEDLIWVVDDYTVKGDGWITGDRNTKWTALLVMSPAVSQSIVQEHRNVRFLLDRRARLTVPFRVEGKLPRLEIKPDVKRLAESIQRGLIRRNPPPSPPRRATREKKRRK
jgi:AsmA-like C-terminal region